MLARGAEAAGVELDIAQLQLGRGTRGPVGHRLVDLRHLDPGFFIRGRSCIPSRGEFALRNFRTCIELAAAGRAGAVCFTPFNKAAMRMAHPPYDDEIGYGREVLGSGGPASEFNILEGLQNARVTSHVPLSAVAELISKEAVLRGIRLTDDLLREAGFERPRMTVAGLNPHAGDGGNFGREEIDVIEPAVEAAKQEGINADGPYPPDTVFVPASKGAFDAVLADVPLPGADRDEAAGL